MVKCFNCNSNIACHNLLVNKTNRFFYCCKNCDLIINYDMWSNISFFIYKNYWVSQMYIYILDNISTDYNSFFKYETTGNNIKIESLISTDNFAKRLAIVKKAINNLEFL